MEINQAKSVPQTASTGSTGASAAAATGSEAGSDGFLSLMNCFMGEGGAEDIDAPDAAPASRPGDAGHVSDPGRHAEPDRSGALLQPDHPAAAARFGRCGGGCGSRNGSCRRGSSRRSGRRPAERPAPAPLQAPVGPRPDLPAKGLAPQPGEGEPAADGGETDQDAEASDQRGRPCEAGGRRQSENRGPAGKAA